MTQLERITEPGYYIIKMKGDMLGTPYTIAVHDGKSLYALGSMDPVLEEDVDFVSPEALDLNKLGQELENKYSLSAPKVRL